MADFGQLPKQRQEWIDGAKGFLLIAVIVSHFGWLPDVLKMVYPPAFVMAFFFLSGLLFSLPSNTPLRAHVNKRIRTLLVPYLYFSVVFLLLDWNLYLKGSDYFFASIKSIVLGNGVPKASALWFVMALFTIDVCFSVLTRLLNTKVAWLVTVVVFLSLLGWALGAVRQELLMKFDVAFSVLPAYASGYWMKNWFSVKFAKMTSFQLIMMAVAAIVISKFAAILNAGESVSQNVLNNYLLFQIGSILGCVGVLVLVQQIWFFTNNRGWVRYIWQGLASMAQNAMPILAIHIYLIIVFDFVQRAKVPDADHSLVFLLKLIMESFFVLLITRSWTRDRFPFLYGPQLIPNWAKIRR